VREAWLGTLPRLVLNSRDPACQCDAMLAGWRRSAGAHGPSDPASQELSKQGYERGRRRSVCDRDAKRALSERERECECKVR